MKFSDLVFDSASCCGNCAAATISLPDGRTLGVTSRDDGLYSASYFNDGGLESREIGLTIEQIEALLP